LLISFVPLSGNFNILTIDFIKELLNYLKSINKSIKVVRFYGSNGSFAVGADLKTLQKFNAFDAKYFSISGNNLFNYLATSHFISIAEIDGYCIGGGLDFAASCDFRFATNKSIFAHPGVNLGFITGFGGTVRVPRESKDYFSRELFYTAKSFKASDLKRSNFLYDTFEDYYLMKSKVTNFINNFSNIDIDIIKNIKTKFIMGA
jgi:enoyl-CoA hydratase